MATTNVTVPFSEPPWLMGLPSPYYNESHRKWQRACRDFIGEHLLPHALDWENDGKVPEHVFRVFSEHNMLIPNLPAPLPIDLLRRLGIHTLLGGLRIEDFDYFHFVIYINEMRRVGISGPASSLATGMAYGMPPIIAYGSTDLQNRILPDLVRGAKRICIAITEPDAGSDVAGIATTAVKSDCGKSYIVSGEKKWITNGVWSDYATMAVRTGGPGPNGLSLLVVPLRNQAGVTMRCMKTSGGTTSGTTFIDLDDVKVPVENLIGQEGRGMKMVTTNFNHERLAIAIGALSAWIDQLVYQMDQLVKKDKTEANRTLGGQMALVKAKDGLVLDECARCAVLLFGGNGYTRTGQGELVEKIYREVPAARIPGGSEDVMLDLAVRQLVKNLQAKTKALGKHKI
ncbi:hypothetical protein SBRCBS47491_009626 [Sporothrix bragantina]|uniref:Acyl-CoA dehydrogenase n=1 Tax=Sporothrix bragantina TaxID=671064 RepID=A0ABP0CW78_9PEZI